MSDALLLEFVERNFAPDALQPLVPKIQRAFEGSSKIDARYVTLLLRCAREGKCPEILFAKNARGNTALHLAVETLSSAKALRNQATGLCREIDRFKAQSEQGCVSREEARQRLPELQSELQVCQDALRAQEDTSDEVKAILLEIKSCGLLRPKDFWFDALGCTPLDYARAGEERDLIPNLIVAFPELVKQSKASSEKCPDEVLDILRSRLSMKTALRRLRSEVGAGEESFGSSSSFTSLCSRSGSRASTVGPVQTPSPAQWLPCRSQSGESQAGSFGVPR